MQEANHTSTSVSFLQARELNFYYNYDKNKAAKRIHALKNISLEIESNTICALIGPSGCGKSTFLRCINRMNELIPNTKVEGEILIKGKNIFDSEVDPVEVRKDIGMVFQKPNPFPKSIYENIAWGARINGIKKNLDELVEKNLTNAGLWEEVKDKLKSSALSLSGGQQQRLCIARTLAINPKIILMDEPTSALDPISTSVIENLIIELSKSYTIVIVTHNMQQAGRISDKTAFFLDGTMIEFDKTADMFVKPKYQKTEEYITGKFG